MLTSLTDVSREKWAHKTFPEFLMKWVKKEQMDERT
jgi:hypothetical protein